MIGWRARIGVLYPADGDLDDELWKLIPDGVSLYMTRTAPAKGELTYEVVIAEAVSGDLEVAAQLLCTIELDCLVFLCTAASFIGGAGYDQKLVQRLRDVSGLPSTTTSTALVEALRTLEVSRLSLVAPYPEEITNQLVYFLRGNEFEVLHSHSLDIQISTDIGSVSPMDIYRLVRKADHEAAQAIFVSCSALRTVEILQALEHDLGKPVLSANQVSLWHSLVLCGVRQPMPNLGKLYTIFP